MAHFTPEEFEHLLNHAHPRSLSLYVPSNNEVGPDAVQREIRLKNLMADALEQLATVDLTDSELERMVKAVDQVLNSAEFWDDGNKGFALFVSPELQTWYQLPVEVPALVVVSHRFHLKPLLKLINHTCGFYLLSLSQKQVQLFRGDRYKLVPVAVPDLPQSLEEVVGTETGERHLQFHTGTDAPRGGERAAQFHGHSSWKDDKQKYLERFLKAIDEAIAKHLQNDTRPLILASVEKMRTHYQDINTYPHLQTDVALKGNVSEDSLTTLHQEAFERLQPYFNQVEAAAIHKYQEEPDAKVSNDLNEILREAALGRVDTLLVAQGVREWGVFNEDTLQVQVIGEQNPHTHDLFDVAAAQTLLKGGKAFSVPLAEMPDGEPIAAVFRY
jgi:hypothetical protein